uniref:PH domain-containing protein n=1 Tax=Heterorhabditis bacteriophora TaxID=37862 RepID=A0A1I7W8M5_HETBA
MTKRGGQVHCAGRGMSVSGGTIEQKMKEGKKIGGGSLIGWPCLICIYPRYLSHPMFFGRPCGMLNQCTRFEPNCFNKGKCKNCYKAKDHHSSEILEKAKMNRKITACGFMYVAPPNLDFSLQSHTAKRWQRRWFTLFDSGELTYALDNNVSVVIPKNFFFPLEKFYDIMEYIYIYI